MLKYANTVKKVDKFQSAWHFQRMMKSPHSLKLTEELAAKKLRGLLDELAVIDARTIRFDQQVENGRADIVAKLSIGKSQWTLVCEVKPKGHPANIRDAIFQLKSYVERHDGRAIPVVIAPYLSPAAQQLCREQRTGYLDLEGNAHLVFDHVFIDRSVATRPASERRELRSLFKPKAAQVLKVLLRDPGHAWRVVDLANEAGVSLGHVSNMRSGLRERGWASIEHDGLILTEPDAVLDAWRSEYEAPVGEERMYYTVLHGAAFENAVRGVMAERPKGAQIALASFSAAQWLAPYGRTGTHFFYADHLGIEHLRTGLKLASASKGHNVSVTVPKDDGLFRDVVEPAAGITCTSPVQTYLDLSRAGERGEEAASHLRQERLRWPK